MRVLLFLFVVFLINLPLAHESWTDHQVATKGHDVEAVVLDAREINGRYLVDYELPAEDDPGPRRTKFSASVDLPTFRNAQTSDRLAVRVVAGKPGENRPDGLVPSSLFKVVAIAGDAVLLLIGGFTWYRSRRRPDGLLPLSER